MHKGTSLVLGLAMTFFATPAFSEEVIKLGVATALSGDIASYGIPTLNAATIVAEQINAKGGIDGKKVVVISQDDQCKSELATFAATKLISDKVDVVIGHICSGATKAALPNYNTTKRVLISPASTAPDLTTSGQNPFFFRTIANGNAQAKLSSSFINDSLKAKKVAIIHDNGEYGKGYAEDNKKLLEAAGKAKVVLFEAVNPDGVDYTSIVRKLRKEKIDVIVFGGYHPTASKLLQQMQRNNVKAAFIGPDSIMTDTFIGMAGKEAEGVYASSPSDTSSLPIYQEARKQHLDKYKAEPGPFYYNAYAAAQVLLHAIDKADGVDPAKIVEILRSDRVQTPAGNVTFDKSGDPIGVGLSLYQVKKGKFVETDNRIE